MASTFLENHQYNIVAKNYRYKRLEIDLVAKKGGLLIFIEVKTRSKTLFGEPEEAVDDKKAARIIEAADQYIYENDWNEDIRFDVISVVLSNKEHQIKHFEDAFY